MEYFLSFRLKLSLFMHNSLSSQNVALATRHSGEEAKRHDVRALYCRISAVSMVCFWPTLALREGQLRVDTCRSRRTRALVTSHKNGCSSRMHTTGQISAITQLRAQPLEVMPIGLWLGFVFTSHATEICGNGNCTLEELSEVEAGKLVGRDQNSFLSRP